jgi:hypothetical protein
MVSRKAAGFILAAQRPAIGLNTEIVATLLQDIASYSY